MLYEVITGFELHRNLFFIDRYFLNQSANQLLIIFGDILRLLCKELLHFADSLFHAFTLGIV